ncbi:outer-membrane lipoprotein carrier protein LolA [Consotaella salsifontis]|uniref:Outer membrane lipoprotein-sorting protein n=1 Tax=Consotaella salsifontis TaxID=1365950 RepID=A0A1T4SCX7_9HYPH|nr:outer-membrane lipoprotein carrier protein LolA [Consotaella salsifontis]SKA26079.1 Outer membrane lipoprotein-sorting protein [Consotaella salsifontis]
MSKSIFARTIRALSAAMLIAAALPLATMTPRPASAAASAKAQEIANHFSSIQSMTGQFIQFDPNGRQSEGKFYIQRPGMIRFDYSGSPVRVISDGSQVAINNRKLNTWDLYPLSKTPLKLLLDQRIDLSAASIVDVKEEADLTTIVMGDKSVFGDSRITMMFDPVSLDLRQWTIRDAQGKDTTVMIYNVKNGVSFQKGMFDIPYTAIANDQRKR